MEYLFYPFGGCPISELYFLAAAFCWSLLLKGLPLTHLGMMELGYLFFLVICPLLLWLLDPVGVADSYEDLDVLIETIFEQNVEFSE